MGLGISLLISCFNRTKLFRHCYPTWLQGNSEHPIRTPPDEIIILNDGGATDLVEAVQDMEKLIEKLGLNIPVHHQHRNKGHTMWSNPAIPHNWLVKQADNPIVVILDPEVAFVNDVLGHIHSFYSDEDYAGECTLPLDVRRRSSCAVGTTYSIQSEFMHVAGLMPALEVTKHPEFISTDPATHQVILCGGPAHGCRGWWRDRYMELGGKDERYVAWGYEDLDLEHRNMRFQPPGICGYDGRAVIIAYGHLSPPNTTGAESTGKNEQLWRSGSPADGVANKGVEWGVIH